MTTPLQMEWNGDEIATLLEGASMRGLKLAGEHLLQVSSGLVPHEEGDLERSGDVDKDENRGAVSVFYDRPYAERQHEDLTLRHDQGRQAKYLEQPMRTERRTMLALIVREAGEALD